MLRSWASLRISGSKRFICRKNQSRRSSSATVTRRKARWSWRRSCEQRHVLSNGGFMRKGKFACALVIVFISSAMAAAQESSPKGDPQTLKLMGQASAFYLEGDYKHAIGPYQKALDREK